MAKHLNCYIIMYLHITLKFLVKQSDVKHIHLPNPDRVWDPLVAISMNTHRHMVPVMQPI